MKHITLFLTTVLTTIFTLLISVTINAEPYNLQLRSRTGDEIKYTSVKWDPAETAVLFIPARNELLPKIKTFLDTAKNNGSTVSNILSKVAASNNNTGIKNKLFLGTLPDAPSNRPDLTNVVVVRDLINIPNAKNYRDREKIIIELEQKGTKTISSVDLLGGQAFRFSDDKRPHVVVMISDDHYKADTWMPPLIEKFQNENELYFTILHGEGGDWFHGIDELDTADSLVIYFRRLGLREDQLDKVQKFIDSGRGFVGLRTVCHGFSPDKKNLKPNHKQWNEFDKKILGSNYHGHGDNKLGSEISNNTEHENSPILKDVKPTTWHSTGSVYFMNPVTDNATIYQYAHSTETQNTNNQKKKRITEKIPVTWTRMHGKTKIAFTALGHWDDAKEPQFQKVFLNLIKWSADKKRD